jgi:hypothetical protein
LKLLNSAPTRSQEAAKKMQKKIARDTIRKISLTEISYFKCGQKNHLKRDYFKKKEIKTGSHTESIRKFIFRKHEIRIFRKYSKSIYIKIDIRSGGLAL